MDLCLCLHCICQHYEGPTEITGKLLLEKIEQRSSAGRFADPGKLPLAGQGVEGAGLAGVGATREGDLEAAIGRKLARCMGGQKIAGAGEGVRGSGHRHRIARPVAIAV